MRGQVMHSCASRFDLRNFTVARRGVTWNLGRNEDIDQLASAVAGQNGLAHSQSFWGNAAMPTSSLLATTASPATSGMSAAALQRIDDHLQRRYLDSGRFAGTQVLVYRRGAIVHHQVAGFADLERRVPMKPDTLFRIYR